MQLTPEQERRIQAIVSGGAYPSAEEALDAALVAMESAVAPAFDGSAAELQAMLSDGMTSIELTEEDFWESVDRETNATLVGRDSTPRS
jgi:Arc/MetJ-type ribon-helix-helix transcriptional regulator